MRQLRGYGPLLALLSAGRYVAFITRLNIVPFYPELMRRYAISYAGAGALYSAFFVGYALTLIPAGGAADRWRPRWLIALGLGLIGVTGGAVALAATFPVALAARAVEGMAVAILFTASLKELAVRFTRENRGKAIGITEAATGLGMLTSLSILPLLSRWVSYQYLLLTLPAMSVAALLLVPLVGAGPALQTGGGDRRTIPLRGLLDRELAIITFTALLGLFVLSGILGWLPTHLTESLGYTKAAASLVIGLMLGSQAVGLYPAGSLSDRIGRRLPVIYAGTAALLVGLAALTILEGGAWMYGLAVLLGLGISWSMTPLTLITMETVTPDRAGTVAAVTVAAGQVGSGLAGVAFGWLLDRTGSFSAIWAAAAALCGVRLLAASRIREGGPRPTV